MPPGHASARAASYALGKQLDPSLNWKNIAWLRTLIVNGINCVEDALLAARQSGDGVVLSNNGGRRLDRAVSPMEVLPGADAVLLGRAAIYGLAVGDQPGAARAIEILRAEVERVIGLLRCDSIADLDPACVRWRGVGRLHGTNSGASVPATTR